jgi:hypothetical protein
LVHVWIHDIYIIVAVLGVAVSSLFYHYLDVNMGSAAKALAWAHLVLMNVGASAAAGMMMYGGYQAERLRCFHWM